MGGWVLIFLFIFFIQFGYIYARKTYFKDQKGDKVKIQFVRTYYSSSGCFGVRSDISKNTVVLSLQGFSDYATATLDNPHYFVTGYHWIPEDVKKLTISISDQVSKKYLASLYFRIIDHYVIQRWLMSVVLSNTVLGLTMKT